MQRHGVIRAASAAALAAWTAPPVWSAPETAALTEAQVKAMLERCDSYRNPDFSYSSRVSLSEFKAGAKIDAIVMRLFARPAPQKGHFHTLASFLQPTRDRGKHMLKAGADVWFYDPASSASIRLSPMQRLLGQAANADVVSTSFSADFAPSLVEAVEIVDGERKKRDAYQLLLTAANASAGYSKIDLWIDRATATPLRARFYTDSGSLLKTIFYRRVRHELDELRPTEFVIIDGSDPKSVTLMQFDEFVAMDVPVQWMQKDHLPLLQSIS